MTTWSGVIGLDHVTVTTPEELEQAVVDWYEQVLGLERVAKPEGTRVEGAWFRVGAQQIHVSEDDHNPPRTAHLALFVEDFDAAAAHLRATGCHIEQARLLPGRHRFFTRDPAGNRIEVLAFDHAGGDGGSPSEAVDA